MDNELTSLPILAENPTELSSPPGGPYSKEKHWQEVEAQFRHTTDRLGYGIEAGILEPVVALNLLGIHTTQSCEGHLERGTGAPWIDVAAADTRELEEQVRLAYQQQHTQPRDELTQYATANRRKLETEIRTRNLAERRKILDYLEEFYQDRRVPIDRQLHLQKIGIEETRLESQGACFQELAQPEIKQTKLDEYRLEMKVFGAFLKEKYISNQT